MNAAEKVDAYPVPEHARGGTLDRHFGRLMPIVEGRIYDLMAEYASSYGGGYWQFVELSNGGFYMSPPDTEYELCVHGNGFQGRMSADAVGITICLHAYSHLSFEFSTPVLVDHFHWLRAFALTHPERRHIIAAID